VHKYGFMLCKTPVCKASWDYSLATIFSYLARDDPRFSYNDCAVVSSSKAGAYTRAPSAQLELSLCPT